MKSTLAVLMTLALLVGAAHAEVAVTSAGGPIIDNSGEVLYAYNFGLGVWLNYYSDGGKTFNNYSTNPDDWVTPSTYVDPQSGIEFTNINHTGNHVSPDLDLPTPTATGIDASRLALDGAGLLTLTYDNGAHCSAGVVSSTDDLYYTATWVNKGDTDPNNLNVNVSGLEANKSYMVQLILGDDRAAGWAAWEFDVYVDGEDTEEDFKWGLAWDEDIEKNVLKVTGLTGETAYSVGLYGNYPGIGGIVVSAMPSADVNGDGIIDAADYILLKQNMGQAPSAGDPGNGGDIDGDGTVDWDDLQTLISAMGGAGQAPAVPEPCSAMLLFAGTAWLMRRRKAKA